MSAAALYLYVYTHVYIHRDTHTFPHPAAVGRFTTAHKSNSCVLLDVCGRPGRFHFENKRTGDEQQHATLQKQS